VVAVTVVMLVVGTALGSVAFPESKTVTMSQRIVTTLIVNTTILQIQTQTSTYSTATSTSISCTISSEGTGFYVTVVTDTGQPIQGVQVSGTLVTQITNGGSCQRNIDIYLTNSTGSVLITGNTGSYYQLTILYQGKNYTAQAPIDPMASTYVDLKIPSGNVSITDIPYGGCLRNSTATICPG
jgi:hypothetical protein